MRKRSVPKSMLRKQAEMHSVRAKEKKEPERQWEFVNGWVETLMCGSFEKRNYLKEDKVDEEEDEARAAEPEEVVAGMNQRRPLNHFTSLLDLQTHLCYYHL